ncbi:MAG: FAD-dependent oxidoreductase [Chloroflexota bacterium]|nr:FAD-dependent oxidoreductase [Chloroflexota bacterium]
MTANLVTPAMGQRYDVAVIGGGPAGLVVALALSGCGASVLVVDSSKERPVVGESLPPIASPLLQEW